MIAAQQVASERIVMSVAPTGPPHEDAGSSGPTPRPQSTPRLPVVRLGSEDPRLQVFFSADESAAAAQAAAQDEFYDARGIALTCTRSKDGSACLQATDEAHPDEVHERIMDVLRTAAEDVVGGDAEAAEVDAVLRWLDDAPTVEYLIGGLGLAPLDLGDDDASPSAMATARSAACHHCSWLQKFFGTGHHCC